jgi:molecular chaperone GrpE
MSEDRTDSVKPDTSEKQDEVPAVQQEPEAAGAQEAEGAAAPEAETLEDPLEAARAETRRIREQMLRIAADFENFRKRARRETEDAARRAKEDLLRELLPVFDNLERAVGHAEQAADAGAVATGVKIVLKQFVDTLGRIGVNRINALGAAFDPTVHEAIQQIESVDQSPGTVLAEVVPGYVWGDRLLRASMVVVAKAPAQPAAPDAKPEASS